MDKNVVVFLSTYNGADYLEQLLNSILNQKNVSVEIKIRDDGSNDGTRTILKRYERKYSNISVVFGENKGWRRSFFDLMFSVKPEKETFYAFADQDDVWLEDKLYSAVNLLKDDKKPQLYHSNLYLVDKNLNKLGFMYSPQLDPVTKNPEAYFEGIGVGATMVMNEKLLSLVQEHEPRLEITHDAYVIELANILGESIYDNIPHILYRRHEKNATGYDRKSNQVQPTIIDRYKKYIKAPKNGFSNRAKELLSGYNYKLSLSDKNFLNLVANYKNNYIHKIKLLFNPKIKAKTLRKTLQLKYRVIFNTL